MTAARKTPSKKNKPHKTATKKEAVALRTKKPNTPKNTGKTKPKGTNRRSAETITQILEASIKVLLKHGESKMYVKAVCQEAKISRGTLYRYFATKEELLKAMTFYFRDKTDMAIRRVTQPYNDPVERFDSFLEYMTGAFQASVSSGMLEVEPALVMSYYRENFSHFVLRLNEALAPVYDAWEKELNGKLNRDLASEMIVRFSLSKLLVPYEGDYKELRKELVGIIKQLRSKGD